MRGRTRLPKGREIEFPLLGGRSIEQDREAKTTAIRCSGGLLNEERGPDHVPVDPKLWPDLGEFRRPYSGFRVVDPYA